MGHPLTSWTAELWESSGCDAGCEVPAVPDADADEPADAVSAAIVAEAAVEETVRSFKEIIEGKHDDLPEQAFYMVGGIDDVVERAKEMS